MSWYHILSPGTEKWVALAVLAVTFGLILYRRFKIAYASLAGAALLILVGVANPAEAFLKSVNWDVLAIYWGYGMLAIAFRESKVPAWIANRVLVRVKSEKRALLFLCVLAMFLSSFMANPVVVIMLAPLAMEIAAKLKASLFLYLIALAVSSNIVTTVSMIADPPAMILATATGMDFLDFYWFQGKISLGTLSMAGILAAILVLLLQFRKLNKPVRIAREEIQVSLSPLALFISSILVLALVPWPGLGAWNHPGFVGLALGISALIIARGYARNMSREFDWNTIAFLVGIFIVIGTVANIGLLEDFAVWLVHIEMSSPTIYLAIFVWISVLLSSFIDNVPFTVLMLPVCAGVAQTLGISPFPFYFGMLVGTGIGGNLTPVGATANVLAGGMLEKRGYKVHLGKYLRVAAPFSISAVLVVHIMLQLLWLK
jgi:Na+/H+ antiporter NhaD/arsenite permease-like protein